MKTIEIRRAGTYVVEETATLSVPDDFVFEPGDDITPDDFEIVGVEENVLDVVDADPWELVT